MKKYLLLFPCFLLISTFQLKAQESIGYTNPDDFQYLLDYRLPDWGYSNFYISSGGFNTSGTYRSFDQELGNPGDPFFNQSETSRANYNTNLGFSPRYELYRESELRTFSMDMISTLSTNFSKSKSNDKSGGTTEESKANSNGQSFRYRISLNHNYYVSEDVFFITDLFSDLRFSRGKTETEFNEMTVNDETFTDRNINFRPSVGIGFGRIRNVTPIIRAIRLNERYKELGNESFSGNEIQNTADTFTKVQGYQRTSNRFLKDFWGDVSNNVNGKLDRIGAFDLFYLNDVFNETLGSRFQGYEASVSVDYLYSNQLSKDNNELNNTETRNFNINRQANLNLTFDWFVNLDLYHQLSFRTQNTTLFPLEKSNSEEWINQTDANAEWLWIFADRFRLDTDLQARYTTRNFKDDVVDKFGVISSVLRTNVFYFIENKMALNAGVSLAYNGVNREFLDVTVVNKAFQWSVNAGIQYYFNRNLY